MALVEIAARYAPLAALAQVTAGPGRIEKLSHALELAAAFDHAIAPDPLLPPELLPADWGPGGGAGRVPRSLGGNWARSPAHCSARSPLSLRSVNPANAR